MFFSKKKKSKTKEVGGNISYYNLSDWWLNELTEEERKFIREIYNPMSSSSEREYIDEGKIISSTQSKIGFLSCLSTWFNKKEYYNIAKKILLEGEKYINDNDDVLDKHFFYLAGIEIYYKNRENDPNALEYAIEYCKRQINISQEAKKAFLEEYPDKPLPGHSGYMQLAIILEKQKKYEEALNLTKQAFLQGWNEDSERRIKRLEKRLVKYMNNKKFKH